MDERIEAIRKRAADNKACNNDNPKCWLNSGPSCGHHPDAGSEAADDVDTLLEIIEANRADHYTIDWPATSGNRVRRPAPTEPCDHPPCVWCNCHVHEPIVGDREPRPPVPGVTHKLFAVDESGGFGGPGSKRHFMCRCGSQWAVIVAADNMASVAMFPSFNDWAEHTRRDVEEAFNRHLAGDV